VTERIYYTQPDLAEFDARVVSIEPAEGGRQAAILDRTAFYPTSGGQPYDTGMLGGVRIVDVIDREDGSILHVFEGAGPSGSVHGRIDWERRFDHMQQHTGQHVLSAAFDRFAGARTVSFHLGAASATIDLAKEVVREAIDRAESEANRIVWEDRPVSIRFASADEAARMPLRKEPARGGELRLIDIEDFDLSACGGTHVARTGAIGIIAVAGWERFRGGSRVEFKCGARALTGFRAFRDGMAECTRLFSVLPAEVPAAIERLQGEGRELKRRNKDLQTRVASVEAAELAARAERAGGLSLVAASLEGWDANSLKLVASHIVERPGHVAVLFGMPAPAAVVAARSADVSLDSSAVLKQLTARFGGKGGGRPELSQGGGLNGSGPELIEFARSILSGV
jgi:alanyl-tRNA synthetase